MIASMAVVDMNMLEAAVTKVAAVTKAEANVPAVVTKVAAKAAAAVTKAEEVNAPAVVTKAAGANAPAAVVTKAVGANAPVAVVTKAVGASAHIRGIAARAQAAGANSVVETGAASMMAARIGLRATTPVPTGASPLRTLREIPGLPGRMVVAIRTPDHAN